jgi:hypothetical protein
MSSGGAAALREAILPVLQTAPNRHAHVLGQSQCVQPVVPGTWLH